MEEHLFMVETSTEPGIWLANELVYVHEKKATEVALKIMDSSNKRVLARVKELKVVR